MQSTCFDGPVGRELEADLEATREPTRGTFFATSMVQVAVVVAETDELLLVLRSQANLGAREEDRARLANERAARSPMHTILALAHLTLGARKRAPHYIVSAEMCNRRRLVLKTRGTFVALVSCLRIADMFFFINNNKNEFP